MGKPVLGNIQDLAGNVKNGGLSTYCRENFGRRLEKIFRKCSQIKENFGIKTNKILEIFLTNFQGTEGKMFVKLLGNIQVNLALKKVTNVDLLTYRCEKFGRRSKKTIF